MKVITRNAEQLIRSGWVRLKTASLSQERLEECYRNWMDFFSSPETEAFVAPPGELDGYFPMRSEKAVGASSPDPKEFFHWYRDGKCPKSCAASTAEVFSRLEEIAFNFFDDLSDALPELKGFAKGIRTSKRLVLRVAHYSAKNEPFLNSAHEDIDFITILPPATESGLEAFENGRWIPAAAKPGECIALSGDMLTEATAGKIKPLRHRVVSDVSERLSMSFFMNPDDDVQLSSRWSAGELLSDRLREIGIAV
ncbi:MAG TPA: 2OG-Fe(II) oxygenase family protein [Oculatellaceae cyanobacterium]